MNAPVKRVRKAVGIQNSPAPLQPPKPADDEQPRAPRPRAPKAQLSKKKPKNEFWNPTDAKPQQPHATVSHFTDPLLKNLVDADKRGDVERTKLALTMMRSSCAFFASEVLSGPPQPPYNGRFVVAEHHEEWDSLVTTQMRLAVLAPRDHGKCPVYDSLLLTVDGRRVKAGEWTGGYVLAYDEKTHKLVSTWAPASRPNGKKRTLKITTRTGRTDTVTENHPFRLWDRWVRSDELKVGQRIAVPRKYPTLGAKKMRSDDAWLLGLLVGDGGLTGGSVGLTAFDVATINAAFNVARANDWDLVPMSKNCSFGRWRINGAVAWAREHGIMGKGAYAKRVPEAIFTAPLRDVADFVAGYLDSDAHVSSRGGGMVEFYSVSEELLRDVQHLLVRLGVVSVLSRKLGKYDGADHHSWRLTVRGRSICALAEHCHPRSQRGETLAALALLQADKDEGGSIDLLPKEVCTLIKHSEGWFRKQGLPRFSKNYDMTRSKARAIADAEGNPALRALADADVLWDEVVSVEDAGEQETFQIHVPGYENYVANDIVQHNTYFFDFAYPIWKAVFTPNGKGYIFSATAPQAARILEDIKTEIESNPKLQWLLPRGQNKKWSSTSITLANGHKIYARGYGTKVRGAHPDWIVVDDGLNDEDAYSEIVRQKNIDYFYTAITNMIVPGGQIIVVGTPFHAADLYADLAKNKRYCFRRFPAVSKEGTALWPTRYCATDAIQEALAKRGIIVTSLESKKIEIGSIRFTREFLCEPISDEMSLFPEKLFRGADVEIFTAKLGMPRRFWKQHGIKTIYVGVDFALSSSTSADYTAVFVLGVDKYGNRWVIDIQQHRGLSYQQQLSLINAVGKKYKPDVIYLEANQMQRIFGDELIRLSDLPIQKFITTGSGSAKARRKKVPGSNTVTQNKNSLEGGVPSLRVLLENKKIRIPRGDEASCEMTDRWVNEMKSFTWADGKLQGVGAHDDLVMAFWIADRAIRDTSFSYEDEDEDQEEWTQDQLMEELLGSDQEREEEEREDAEDDEDSDVDSRTLDAQKRKRIPEVDPVLLAVSRFTNPNAKPEDLAEDELENDAEDIDPDGAMNLMPVDKGGVAEGKRKARTKQKPPGALWRATGGAR